MPQNLKKAKRGIEAKIARNAKGLLKPKMPKYQNAKK